MIFDEYASAVLFPVSLYCHAAFVAYQTFIEYLLYLVAEPRRLRHA